MIDSIKKYMLGVFYADSREIASLNGIRSWGIFMLFAGHLYRFMPNVDQSAGWLRNALDNTSQCLDLFFVLSGFLISGPLMRQLERTGTLDLKNFYTKRSLRIFPAYFIFCALQYFVFIPVMIHSDPAHADMLSEWRGRIIYDLLYVSNYIRGTIFHGWSLSLEEQFYLLFPFLLLVVFRYFGKRGRLVFLLLFTVAPLIYRGIILFTVILPSPAADHINLYNKLIYYPFHGHYDSVFIGVILAFIYQNYGSLIDRIYNDHRLFYTIQAVAALGLVAYSTQFWEFEASIWGMVIRFPVFSTLWAMVMLTSMKQGTLVNRLLSFKIYSPIAKLSYCAYLIHIVVMAPLIRKIFGARPTEQWEAIVYSIPISIAIMVVAYFFHLVAERPFMVLKEKYAGKALVERRAAQAEEAS